MNLHIVDMYDRVFLGEARRAKPLEFVEPGIAAGESLEPPGRLASDRDREVPRAAHDGDGDPRFAGHVQQVFAACRHPAGGIDAQRRPDAVGAAVIAPLVTDAGGGAEEAATSQSLFSIQVKLR